MNENRFFLRTKILIKIKIRDKKKFTKNFMGGEGEGAIFLGGNFPRGHFSGDIFARTCIRNEELIFSKVAVLEPAVLLNVIFCTGNFPRSCETLD